MVTGEERNQSMALQIKRGKIQRAKKIVIYGPEGIGKTTFAAAFPDPVFIDTEGGSDHMDVARIEDIYSWDDLCMACSEVAREKPCKTLVIDTADWAEQMLIDKLLMKYKKQSLSDFGYGSGHVMLAEEFSDLIAILDTVIASGINVVVTAHAAMRKFEQPDEQGAYDRWEMKLTRKVAPLLKEWADCLFFLNYETYVIHGDAMEKNKVGGGERVMYTSHNPVWDAKNRFGLPEKLPIDYKAIEGIMESKSLLEMTEDVIKAADLTPSDVMKVAIARGKAEEGQTLEDMNDRVLTWINKYIDNIKIIINKENENG